MRLSVALLLTLVCTAVGSSAASAAEVPRSQTLTAPSGLSWPAVATQASTTPTFRPVWTRHAHSIEAGAAAVFTLDPVSAVRCKLVLHGPRPGQRIAWHIAGKGRLAIITLQTRRRATPGRWLLTASCLQSTGAALTSQVSVDVDASRDGGGALVSRRGIHVRRRALFLGRGAEGVVHGRGAGANPFMATECTYWAFAKREDVYDRALAAGVHRDGLVSHPAFSQDYVWNGKRWADNAQRAGIPTGSTPVAGALFVNTAGRFGHVAYVERVYADGSFQISQHNQSGRSDSSATTYSTEYPGRPGVVFVYGGPAGNPYAPKPSDYIGHIVQWDGDRNTQKTAWLVGQDGKRYWIPTIAIYWCLKGQGVPGPDVLPAAMLDRLPDTGKWAACSSGSGGDPPPPSPSPPSPSPPPPSPPPTYAETTGGVTHTWTNYTNAGGYEGPTIPSNTTVQIACKLTGFRVADGNTWWYRIASSPWNGSYYASADAFYNNGQTSGSLRGTPFVDPNVRDC
jgi:hypothetical protein